MDQEQPKTTSPQTGSSRAGSVPQAEEPTIGRLVGDLSRDVSSLVRNEIALAKSEIRFSVKAGGVGIGLFAAAAFLGVLAIIILSVAIAFLIHLSGLDLAWCFLIVFGVYLVLAALLAFLGLRSIKKVRAPERSIDQAKQTAAVLKKRK